MITTSPGQVQSTVLWEEDSAPPFAVPGSNAPAGPLVSRGSGIKSGIHSPVHIGFTSCILRLFKACNLGYLLPNTRY